MPGRRRCCCGSGSGCAGNCNCDGTNVAIQLTSESHLSNGGVCRALTATRHVVGTVTDDNGTWKFFGVPSDGDVGITVTDCGATYGATKSSVQLYTNVFDGTPCPHLSLTLDYRYTFSCVGDGTVRLAIQAYTILCNTDGKEYYAQWPVGAFTLSEITSAIATPSCDGSTLSATFTFSGTLSGGQSWPTSTASVSINIADQGYYCCQDFVVYGCNGIGLAGVGVTVASVTKTTDSSGKTHVAWSSINGCSDDATIDAGSARFDVATVTSTFTTNATTTVTLTVASGYHCIAGCEWPISNTLHATHPVFGAITYTYSAGSWVATVSYAYPGLGACPAKTVTVTCTWDGATTYTEAWKYAVTNCPDDTGGSTHTATWVSGALVCPMSFSKTFTLTPAGTPEQNLYGAGAMTLSLTE